MVRNCEGFESYHKRIESGEGNKLEWMDLFREYQGIKHFRYHLNGLTLAFTCMIYGNYTCLIFRFD